MRRIDAHDKNGPAINANVTINPEAIKEAGEQRGHGIGVSMEVYTNSDLAQKRVAKEPNFSAVLVRTLQPIELVSLSLTGLNGVNGVTRNRWVFLSV